MARTARQRAASRRNLIKARRKRRRKGNPKYGFGRSYQAGLALGMSDKLNARAGLKGNHQVRVTKSGQYDKRHMIKKNKKRRVGGVVAGAYTTTIGLAGAAAAVQIVHGNRTRSRTRRAHI